MEKDNNDTSNFTVERKKSIISEKLIHAAENYTITWKNGINFTLSRDDLIHQESNAIVNAANSDLWLSGGVAGDIRTEAGEVLSEECVKIIKERGKSLEIGEVVYTSKGNMKNKNLEYIFHSVGPCYRGGKFGEEIQLFNAFYNCFLLAEKLNLYSISIPPISSGRFGYPKSEVAQIFYKAMEKFVLENLDGNNSLKEIKLIIIDFPTYFVFAEEHNRILKDFKEKFKDFIVNINPDFSSLIDIIKKNRPDEVSEQITDEINTLMKEFENETNRKMEND